jgi:hypothetical protein
MKRPRVSPQVRERIVALAKNRCGYCLSSGRISGVMLQLDHLVPFADGGSTEESNLWLACADCNRYRSDRSVATDPETQRVVRLFNPRNDKWGEHFAWLNSGALILGTTENGRATVAALRLNRRILVDARQQWIAVGWHPPRD